MVGDPGGGDRGGVVVQVGRRGDAVVLDCHLPATVGADALQYRDRPAWARDGHKTKCTDPGDKLKAPTAATDPPIAGLILKSARQSMSMNGAVWNVSTPPGPIRWRAAEPSRSMR